MQIIAAIIGVLLVVLTLWDVFIVMVLTRRASRRLQVTNVLVYIFRRVYSSVARGVDDRTRRERYLSMSGPILLFSRFGVWASALILGFALLQWAAGSRIVAPDGSASFGTVTKTNPGLRPWRRSWTSARSCSSASTVSIRALRV
jgi:hypothetical protein